jgi:CubicO group peptidase (beta-lactamase class C family)
MERDGRNTPSRSRVVYGFLLGLYAPEFLARHRAEMLQNFEDLENASSSTTALWLLIGEDLMLSFISRKIPKSFWGHTAPIFAVLVVVLAVWRALAFDAAPVSDPTALDFSSARLARIAAWQQTQVDAGSISGAVAAISRNGKVAYLRAVGFRDQAKNSPLQPDAMFWIASMTKPVTSVAAMMLVEEGKLDLAAPVHRYIPEFKDMMVAVETTDPASGQTRRTLEPQKRAMIVEDLLRHTSGLVYPNAETAAGLERYRKLFARDSTLKDLVSRLARDPLADQPGEAWHYGISADVLARVIEVTSGQPFDQFLDSRLFKPLGMVDTGFWVPPEKLHRLIDPPVGALMLSDRDVTKPTTMFSGGGGLVSTASDYLRFCQMLLNGGELDGMRILSPATVRRMTTNALPDGVRSTGLPFGSTFGLGFAIRNDAASSWVPGSVGSFSWNGVWGTYFWVDPIQATRNVEQFQTPFRKLTYGAFLIPDQGTPASAPAPIDQAALAAFEGTYRFESSSSRDRQKRAIREFVGVGVDVTINDGVLTVVSPIPNTPGAKAGVMANDVITHIDDEATRGKSLNQLLEKIRGPENTRIRLRIARKGQDAPIELEIVRARFRVAGTGADLQVAVKDGKLLIEGRGALPVLEFEQGAPIAAVPMSSNEFVVDGGDHTRMAFLQEGTGEPTGLVLNPGPWQITGQRIN